MRTNSLQSPAEAGEGPDGGGRLDARHPARAQTAAAVLSPFAAFGGPCTPMRLMFAPLEIALFLPAYAIQSFHGRR